VHRSFGQQLEDRGADIAALAASATAASTAARATGAAEAEAQTAAGIKAELEAAARAEATAGAKAGRKVGPGVVLTQVVAEVVAKLTAGLPPLLVKRTPIARAEAKAERAWGRSERVGHWGSLRLGWKRLMRYRYVDDISEPIAMQRFVRQSVVARANVTATTLLDAQ
jgi:hypothetical protein